METEEADSISQNSDSTFSTPLTREALYELVWPEPMLKMAARFNVSSSYMARICTLLNVPRPERGYRAKFAVGKAPPKPQLPDARPGDELVWSRNGEHTRVGKPLPRPPSTPPSQTHQNVFNEAQPTPSDQGRQSTFRGWTPFIRFSIFKADQEAFGRSGGIKDRS